AACVPPRERPARAPGRTRTTALRRAARSIPSERRATRRPRGRYRRRSGKGGASLSVFLFRLVSTLPRRAPLGGAFPPKSRRRIGGGFRDGLAGADGDCSERQGERGPARLFGADAGDDSANVLHFEVGQLRRGTVAHSFLQPRHLRREHPGQEGFATLLAAELVQVFDEAVRHRERERDEAHGIPRSRATVSTIACASQAPALSLSRAAKVRFSPMTCWTASRRVFPSAYTMT